MLGLFVCFCIGLTFHISKDSGLKFFSIIYFYISIKFSWFSIPYSIKKYKNLSVSLFFHLPISFLFPTCYFCSICFFSLRFLFINFFNVRDGIKIFLLQLLPVTGNKHIFERWYSNWTVNNMISLQRHYFLAYLFW